jgi:TPR repeat protein
MYSQGLGVDEDEAETVKWYKLAAKQDYAKAHMHLGSHVFARPWYG